MTVNERSPDTHETESANSPLRSSSCFFEWALLPQHRLNGSTDLFRCDLCMQEVTGGEVSLKLHQLGLHINPYYLSASDRILAQISSYVVQTDKTEGPWVPDWDTFKGLYRCHHCFLLCNEGSNLLQHLSIHKPIEDDLEDVPLARMKSPKKSKAEISPQKSQELEDVIDSSESQLNDDHELKEGSPKKHSRDLDESQDLQCETSEVKQISSNESNENEDMSKKAKKKVVQQSTLENGLALESPKKRIRKPIPNGQLVDVSEAEVPEQTNKRPDRKCKSTTNTLVAMLSSTDDDLEWKKLISMSTTSNTTKSSSNTAATTTAKDNAKKTTANKVKNKKVVKKKPIKSARTPNPTKITPKPSRRLSAIDNERVSTIVSSVLEKEPSFQCLQCPQSFPSYSDLCQHKSDAHPLTKVNSLKPSKCNNEEPLNKNRELKEVDADLKTCLTNALDSVPEVTFNNMHGTIKDIGSLDAQEFQSKTLGTVEKVKMNVSEKWTRKDVWESGWESSNHVLNWHKYQSTEFLQQMASVSWSEQRLFQDAFNTKKKSSPVSTKEVTRKSVLAQGLQLKQVNKSVKYMTQIERQKKTKKTKENPDDLVVGALNGEWEKPHDFMCSSCAIVYDELREVLHHKWEAHPYCLVAHVTLKRDLNLPPSNLMHPQVGRNLGKHKRVKIQGIRKISKKTEKEEIESSFNCSKCSTNFEDREAFYVHVLECGGQTDWDLTKKKKKKKKGLAVKRNSTENNPEEAALRKRARFERFNRPPPLAALNGGRMTRRQAVIIKKEKKSSRGKAKKKKRVNATKKEPNTNEVKKVRKPKKTFEPRTPTSERIRRSTAFYGASNSTPKDQGNDEVRKIVQAIMEEMLAKVEKASKVIVQAEQFNLDVVKAKEVQSRRNSTDSNCSLKHIHEQIPPVEEILDIVKEESVAENNVPVEEIVPSTEVATPKINRRSSFAASFYASRPSDGNSVRTSKRRKSSLSREIIENEPEKIEIETKPVENTLESTEMNEDKPVIQLKKRGRKPKRSRRPTKKINHVVQHETSKTEIKETATLNGQPEVMSSEETNAPVPPKRRATIADSIENVELVKPKEKHRRKSIHSVMQNSTVTSSSTDEKPVENLDNDSNQEEKPQEETSSRPTRPQRRSSFAASFYLSGTELENEFAPKRSRKRKQSTLDQSEPSVPVVVDPKVEDEEKPIIQLKKRNRKESEPEQPKMESTSEQIVESVSVDEEDQPIKPRKTSESEKSNSAKKKKRRKKSHEQKNQSPKSDKIPPIEDKKSETEPETVIVEPPESIPEASPEIVPKSEQNDTESSEVKEPNESEEVDDKKPKRRSSFAASFYSAMPKSERSLRRSNGRVNYFEDILKDEMEDEGEASISPIRRKKRPIKEAETVEPKRIDTDESISDADSRSGSRSRSRRQLNNNLSDSSCGSSSRVIFPVEVKACAIQRIVDGETQVQVARDLDCPVSTIASWWHRRASILPNLAVDSSTQSDSASATDDTELSDSTPRSPKCKKRKKKKFNLNRNVLLSQMKERVEAAFVAAEESSADEEAITNNGIIEQPQKEIEPPVIVEQPEAITSPEKVTSEESSNSSEAANPKEDVKIKNAILRNCFASLHRRQKIEKEQEYHQYLNNGN